MTSPQFFAQACMVSLRSQAWCTGTITAVVATIAFGMGIDKSDIRYSTLFTMILHWFRVWEHDSCILCAGGSFTTACLGAWKHLHRSVEAVAYLQHVGIDKIGNAKTVQESGRAGRDGQVSQSILYVSPADVEWCQRISKPQQLSKVGAMVEYATEVRCRRAQLLAYFDEKNGKCREGTDELCDVCCSAAAVREMQQHGTARRAALVRLLLCCHAACSVFGLFSICMYTKRQFIVAAVQESAAAPARTDMQAAKPHSTWHMVANPSVPVKPGTLPSTDCADEENIGACIVKLSGAVSGAPVIPGRLPLHASRKQPAGATRHAGLSCLNAVVQETQDSSNAKRPVLPLIPISRIAHARCKRKFVPPRARSNHEL